MKVTYTVIFSLAFLAASSVFAFPASSTENDKDTESVSVESDFGGQPIVDTGVIGGFPSFSSSPFDGLFESLAGMMTRMRQQMETLLNRFPQSNGTEPIPSFGAFGPGLIGDIDLGKGNTTSVTKIVDGHKVVINETEYKQEGPFGGSVFKVRIIDVKPDSEELPTEKDAETVTTPSKKDVESIENTFDNEIPKNLEKEDSQRYENMETFDEMDGPSAALRNWNLVEPLESFEDNSVVQPVRDLSHDIFVNQILADRGAPTNPDAEVFDVETLPFVTSRGQPFEPMINPR